MQRPSLAPGCNEQVVLVWTCLHVEKYTLLECLAVLYYRDGVLVF